MKGCASSATPPQRAPVLVEYIEPTKPPAKAAGGAVALPAEPYSPNEAEAMSILGLPEGGVCLTIRQAEVAAQLRVYADEAYSVASYNWQAGKVGNQMSIKYLEWADAQLAAEREKKEEWMERYRGELGFVVGVAVTILVVYGVSAAESP